MRIMIASALTVLLAGSALGAPHYSKMEPAAGGLPSGQSVLVDDGTCPPGRIKQVTGGDIRAGTSRSRTCVRR